MFSFTKFYHPSTQRTVNPDIGGHLLDSHVFRLTCMKTLELTKQRPSQQEKSPLELVNIGVLIFCRLKAVRNEKK